MAGGRHIYPQVEDPIGNRCSAEKPKRGGKSAHLCLLVIFKLSFPTLPTIFPLFKSDQIGGKSDYFRWERSTCKKKFSIFSKIYKKPQRLRIFWKISIFLLITPIFTNICSVDLYHLQVYDVVRLIKIIKYTVMSWLVVKIYHFVRPTQTSI